MADTFTTNLHLTLPEIGASDDSWGDKLNDDLAALDALFGTTGAGTVIVRDANNDALVSGVNLTKAAGNARLLKLKSGTLTRWDLGADATAEGGANAGSLFKLSRYDDAGSFLGVPIAVDRASGLVTFETTPQVGANAVWHAGNDTPLRNPVGGIIMFGGTNVAPTNWLFCFGQVLSQTTYAALYAEYGSTYNTGGEGPGNFRMPDLRCLVPVGRGSMGGTDRGLLAGSTVVGALLGSQTATLTIAQLPVFTPDGSVAIDEHGGHFHGPGPGGTSYLVGVGGGGPFALPGSGNQMGSTANTATVTTGITAAFSGTPVGSGAAHANVQPSIVLNFIARAFP